MRTRRRRQTLRARARRARPFTLLDEPGIGPGSAAKLLAWTAG